MTELKVSPSMAQRSQLSGPIASVWPTTSSSVRGRMRTASGATLRRASFSISVNSVSMPHMIPFRQPERSHEPFKKAQRLAETKLLLSSPQIHRMTTADTYVFQGQRL